MSCTPLPALNQLLLSSAHLLVGEWTKELSSSGVCFQLEITKSFPENIDGKFDIKISKRIRLVHSRGSASVFCFLGGALEGYDQAVSGTVNDFFFFNLVL